jgi:hypothetical protein
MPPTLPQAMVVTMAERAHRMHHYLWHTVREGRSNAGQILICSE